MSLEPRNQAERNRVEKTAKSFFRSQAWEVEDFAKGHGHFIVKKEPLKLFVSCHDSEGHKFFPSEATMDAMAKKALDVKNGTRLPIIFVFTCHLPDVVPDIAARRGLYMFTPGELAMVTQLDRFKTELPSPSLPERQKGVLREQPLLCFSIIERFRASGALSAAIEWAEYAADAEVHYTKAHGVLLALLLEAGEQTAAASLCEKVLKKHPDNLFFLRSMQALSAKPGIDRDGDAWGERIAKAKEQATFSTTNKESLDAILHRQAAAMPSKRKATSVSGLTETRGRGILQFVRRVFPGKN